MATRQLGLATIAAALILVLSSPVNALNLDSVWRVWAEPPELDTVGPDTSGAMLEHLALQLWDAAEENPSEFCVWRPANDTVFQKWESWIIQMASDEFDDSTFDLSLYRAPGTIQLLRQSLNKSTSVGCLDELLDSLTRLTSSPLSDTGAEEVILRGRNADGEGFYIYCDRALYTLLLNPNAFYSAFRQDPELYAEWLRLLSFSSFTDLGGGSLVVRYKHKKQFVLNILRQAEVEAPFVPMHRQLIEVIDTLQIDSTY